MSRGEGNLGRLALAVCAAAFGALSLAAAARADIRYASPAGGGPSGDGQCALANPCNIQAAVEDPAVADGDIVRLLAGGVGYNLGTNQLVIDDDITIEPNTGLPRQTFATVYTGSGGAVDVSTSAPGAIVRSVLISHGGSNLPSGLNLPVGTAERVYVVSNGFLACAVGSGTLRDSVCFLAGGSGIGAVGWSQGGGGAQSSTLRNVTAISKVPSTAGLVLNAAAAPAALTMNAVNVIAESPAFDVFATAASGASAAISLSNSSYPNPDAAGANASVTANTVSGNQAAPPLFTNFAANVFSQAPGSPTIDAGANDPLLGALDVDGNPRVVQGAPGCPSALPDIGAYEAPAVTPANCALPATNPATQKRKKCKKGKRKKSQAAAAKKKRCKRKKRR